MFQMQQTSFILVAGFLMFAEFQDSFMDCVAIIFFQVYSTKPKYYFIFFVISQFQQCNSVITQPRLSIWYLFYKYNAEGA